MNELSNVFGTICQYFREIIVNLSSYCPILDPAFFPIAFNFFDETHLIKNNYFEDATIYVTGIHSLNKHADSVFGAIKKVAFSNSQNTQFDLVMIKNAKKTARIKAKP